MPRMILSDVYVLSVFTFLLLQVLTVKSDADGNMDVDIEAACDPDDQRCFDSSR